MLITWQKPKPWSLLLPLQWPKAVFLKTPSAPLHGSRSMRTCPYCYLTLLPHRPKLCLDLRYSEVDLSGCHPSLSWASTGQVLTSSSSWYIFVDSVCHHLTWSFAVTWCLHVLANSFRRFPAELVASSESRSREDRCQIEFFCINIYSE